jgi:ABC-2 type transport system permease protein
MFKSFFTFEIKNGFRTPMVYIFFIVFAILTCLATCIEGVVIGGGVGNVLRNAPFVVQQFYAVMSIFGLFLATAFINAAALRDFENNTHQIIFSRPISKVSYYFGHFFGAITVAILPLLGVSLGIVAGTAINSITQNIDIERFGAHDWQSHLNSVLVFVIPNIFFCGAIVYAVATNTRNTMYSYIATLLLLVAYLTAGSYMKDLKNENIAIFLDPFGIRTFSLLTKYWTVEDKNTLSLGLSGMMLLTRLLWFGIGMMVLFFGYQRFSFSEKTKAGKKENVDAKAAKMATAKSGQMPILTPNFGIGTTLAQLLNQTKVEMKGIFRSTPFILLTLIGMMNMLPNLINAGGFYGNTTHPVTYQMCDLIQGAFYLFTICVLTFFSGELVWKERQARMNDIYDAMPTKSWTIYLGKFIALGGVIAAMLVIVILSCIIAQAAKGYTNFELAVYFKRVLVLDFLGFMYLGAMSMLLHTLVNNKYIGFFAFVIFVALNSFMWGGLHIESNMVQFGATPNYTYSDMNKFGPFVKGLIGFNIYWALFSAIVGIVTILFWMRGRDTDWKNRIYNFKLNYNKNKFVIFGLIGTWLFSAGFVYYNTKVINKYMTSNEMEKMQVEYEKKYKQYEHISQPRITDIKFKLDLFPEERRLEADGDMIIKNKTDRPIDSLHILLKKENGKTFSLAIERAKNIYTDEKVGYQIFKFEPALAAGDSIHFRFHTSYITKGFENEVSNTSIVQNGSFFNTTDFVPEIGYQPNFELSDKNKRKEHGLAERSRMPELEHDCSEHCKNTYISNNSDWVNLETTIGTSTEQIAVAPGSLIKEWTEGNRRYFQYKLDHFALNFFSFISAKYEVKKDNFNDVAIEIYYQKGHEYNVDKMIKSIKKSLEYYTTNFGPFYNKQCRIIEFPRYASFAQAFPGTMPYSEGIGFIADLEDEDDIDMVYYVVAHEMGHQWWAHQVCGANMQGATMLSETFAQYSALMVMEKEYGRDIMRKFLKYEMDKYLRARGEESQKELPLMKAENQGYIHYRKGSVVMYYLKEMIGENAVNQSLQSFLARYKYKEPPYPTAHAVVDEFKRNTPDSLQYLIKDMFEDITLFNNRTKEAKFKAIADGKYEVTIVTESQKFKANELGKESEVPMEDWVEIGALAKPEGNKKVGKLLYRKTVKVNKKDNTFTFIVGEKPDKAGIDLNFYLIDRMPEDNLKNVEELKPN